MIYIIIMTLFIPRIYKLNWFMEPFHYNSLIDNLIDKLVEAPT